VALPLSIAPARATAQPDSTALRLAADSLMRAWLATNPDRGFLSAGNQIGYGVEYLAAGKPTEASWSLERAEQDDVPAQREDGADRHRVGVRVPLVLREEPVAIAVATTGRAPYSRC
jgi:hypothetical protein